MSKLLSLIRYGMMEKSLDVEIEPLIEGRAEIKLSKETKARIREPWAKAFYFFFGETMG